MTAGWTRSAAMASRAIGRDNEVTGAYGSEEEILKTVTKLFDDLP